MFVSDINYSTNKATILHKIKAYFLKKAVILICAF